MVLGELRAFVYKRKLTALSQYYSECFFPTLERDQKEIVERVHAFHDALEKVLASSMESYIIDLVVHVDHPEEAKHSSGVTLVELNPWSDQTGSALFSRDADCSILLGESPFEFRFRTEAPPLRAGGSWQALICQAKTPAHPTVVEDKPCLVM